MVSKPKVKAQTNRGKPKAEEALWASAERYRSLFLNSMDAFLLTAPDGSILEANPSACEMFGHSEEELLTGGRVSIVDVLDPRLELALEERARTGKFKGELTFLRKDGSKFPGEISTQIFTGEIGQARTSMVIRDITERKRAEEALRDSEELHRIILGSISDAVFITDNHGDFIYVCSNADVIFGYSQAEVSALGNIGKLLGDALFDPREFDTRHEIQNIERRIITKTGVPRDLLVNVKRVSIRNGTILYTCRDITERKQAEDALQRSQQEYKVLLNTIDGVVWEADAKTFVFSYASQQAERLLGYPIERWTSEPTFWKDHIHADDQNWAVNYCVACTQAKISHEFEYRMIASDGHIVWLRDIVAVIVENNEPVKLRGIMVDITERKRTEEALHESQQRLSLFFNQSLDGFFFSMLDDPIEWNDASDKENLLDYAITHQHISEANDAVIDQYGSSREKFIGRTASDFFVHDVDQGRRLRRNLFDSGRLHLETEERKDDGTPVWVEGDYVCMYDHQNRITGMFGIQRDVTGRRQAEETLRGAENKYRNLVERLPQVIYTSELGNSGVWSYVSPQIEKLLGFTPQEWMNDSGLWFQQVHPDDRAIQLALEEQAFARNEPFESEYRMLTRAGSWIWVRDSGHIFPPQAYGPPIVQGILTDITERKRAVEELNIREAQLLANLNTTPNVAIQWYDKDGRILYWNPASESLYGWKSMEAIGKTLAQLTHTPEEQAEFMRIIAEVQETHKPFGPYEMRIRHKDGAENWVLTTTFSLPMNDDQIGFVCMDVDITERKQAEERIQQQLRRLNALHSIDMAINSSVNIQITLEVLLTQLLSQLKMDAADVLLFNQPAQTLELIVGRGFRSNIALQSHQRVSEGFAGQVINERRTIHISNLMEAGRNLRQMLLLANDSFTEYIGLPLIAKGQIKGVLEIYQRVPLEPDEDWSNFLEVLAGQAAIAIDNAQLLQGLQRSNMELVLAYDATIEGWSRAMDLRDKETEGHTQRVTTMTLDLARAMGIREAEILHIQRGGLLHDIGKLGVPDNILLKQGELTAEEWETMRQHPAYAFNMLANIPYLRQSLDIPYCHHEKWDGTGYPQGLKGEQIPLSARIFAVADVWDALTNDRPYRKAWAKEKTIEFIKEQSGKHFDPRVVKAFLTMTSEKLQEAFE